MWGMYVHIFTIYDVTSITYVTRSTVHIIAKPYILSCRSLVFSGTVHWFEGRQAFIHYCGLHQVWREPGNILCCCHISLNKDSSHIKNRSHIPHLVWAYRSTIGAYMCQKQMFPPNCTYMPYIWWAYMCNIRSHWNQSWDQKCCMYDDDDAESQLHRQQWPLGQISQSIGKMIEATSQLKDPKRVANVKCHTVWVLE